MNDIEIEGLTNIIGGEYENIKIDGMSTCSGDLVARNILIHGKFKSLGSTDAEMLNCQGMSEFKGNIKSNKIICDGMISVKGDIKNSIKIEADEIYCDGFISVDGEISADKLVANGCISASEIVGDNIIIKSKKGKVSNFIANVLLKKYISKVDLIEATNIEISGVRAKSVNGENIRIEKNCMIENLYCSGSLFVHSSAKVNSITGDYTVETE